jgi:hypothetical protein
MDLRPNQDVLNQSKVRAVDQVTVEQFRYFSSDCVKYYNRSQIPSPKAPAHDDLVQEAASPGDRRPSNIRLFAIVTVAFARLRRTLERTGLRRSIAT